MKKIFGIVIAIVMLLMVIPSNASACSSYIDCDGNDGPERIVLGSYTLTEQQTSQLATNMKILSGASATITNAAASYAGETILRRYGYSFGPYGTIAALAASLSGIAVADSAVIFAGENGYRIRVTMTDYKNYHTSYSTQVDYTIVF
ncbi:hypothetical protein [Virgibacillus necropolis]|uniref:Uncharacterized protein n=1 Tax=Virgibacillus necropolis TaxID=163877 RepID=A0A221M920_9BACI|nr:hypothetical protein [Virgibacillus necropolis]ASN04143.1 hypothetical protein CFK40_03540 [Virgibacillus necropolis]